MFSLRPNENDRKRTHRARLVKIPTSGRHRHYWVFGCAGIAHLESAQLLSRRFFRLFAGFADGETTDGETTAGATTATVTPKSAMRARVQAKGPKIITNEYYPTNKIPSPTLTIDYITQGCSYAWGHGRQRIPKMLGRPKMKSLQGRPASSIRFRRDNCF